MVISHGGTEKQFCEYMASKLHLRIISYSKGKNNIEISTIMRELNKNDLKMYSMFKKRYGAELEIVKDKKIETIKNFKVYIIMDTDKCSEELRKSFINKKMFENHWMYNYIIPIYNIERIEDALKKADIAYAEHKNEKGNYSKIFPIEHKKIVSNQDFIDIKNIRNTFRKNRMYKYGDSYRKFYRKGTTEDINIIMFTKEDLYKFNVRLKKKKRCSIIL